MERDGISAGSEPKKLAGMDMLGKAFSDAGIRPALQRETPYHRVLNQPRGLSGLQSRLLQCENTQHAVL